MRTPILFAALAATLIGAAPATAQTPREARQDYRDEVRDARRDYRRDIRGADNPRDVYQANREYRRDVRDARQDYRRDTRDWRGYRNYDYNRLERGQRYYYADRYYREGNYPVRRLGYNDRIYSGSNGRYYCRRSDGTTGLIVGGIAGGALGSALASGRSNTLGILLGAGAGAAIGSSIDRNNVRCR